MNTWQCPTCGVTCMSASFDRAQLRDRHRCVPPEPPDFQDSVLPPRLEALRDAEKD